MSLVRNHLRIGVSVLGAIFALALPGVAQAHHNPPVDFVGATAATIPTIDGVIGAGEWTDTTPYDVTIAGLPGTVRFKHDDQYLYVAMTMTDDSGGSKEMGAFFDDNHDGIKDPGEDVMLGFASPFSFGADYYYSSAGASGATHYPDNGTDGTNPPGNGTDDILGAGQVAGSQVTFEVRHVGGAIGTGVLTFGEDSTEQAVLAEAAGNSLSPEQKAFRAAWLGSKQRAAESRPGR